jgi:hypothetical protein
MAKIDLFLARCHSPAAMSAARSPLETMAKMAGETAVRYGLVPRELGGLKVEPGFRIIADGQFLLRCDSGYGYHYVPGEGITIERPDHADPDEEVLWLNGSVYAAVACLNGLYPIHASAVASGGQVFAFTGPPGAGKSTLVTGLGQRGLPMFCDDTLLLDLSDSERVIALPGHKRLKLTSAALDLTGLAAQQPVGADTGKSYVAPPAGDVGEPLPLAQLVFLEQGPSPQWHAIEGAERFVRLADDHYTQDLYHEAQRPDRAALFELRARLAGMVTMARLVRPFSSSGFAASLDLAERELGLAIGEELL